jgi:ABC-type Fe3+-hydroxamate transport system substrate-binding protein
LRPDAVVTQDRCALCAVCAVCAVSSEELGSACPVGAEVISLDPSTLDEVAASIQLHATRIGVPERGSELAGEMRRSIDDLRQPQPGLALLGL